jgi:hypothetical protein
VSSLVPRPEGLSFKQWFEWTVDALPVTAITGNITDENWQIFARQLMVEPYLQNLNIIGYNDNIQWQDWATSLILAVENA